MGEIKFLINLGFDVSYKHLSICKMTVGKKRYVQVHCDYPPLQFSEFYKLSETEKAISQFLKIRREYTV